MRKARRRPSATCSNPSTPGHQGAQRSPSAIVLITDGAWNAGRDPAEAARALGLRNIPVYPIGIGNPEPPLDVPVLSLRGPQESPARRRALPRSHRHGHQRRADARHRRVARRRPRRGRAAGSDAPRRPAAAGRDDLRAAHRRPPHLHRPRPPDRGPPDIGKNQAETTVDIVDRKIRVLLIDAEPRWEFRFIRSVIERDPGVTPTICLLRPGVGPIKGAGYLSELPTDKKASPTSTWFSWATCRATCCPSLPQGTGRHGPHPRRRAGADRRPAAELLQPGGTPVRTSCPC